KFTDRGGIELAVETESTTPLKACLRFSVRDTGVGIERDKQNVIFHAFEQADKSTTRNYGGTGLGLAISAKFVEMMGGDIWVESQPGEGSTFHFTAKFGLNHASSDAPRLGRTDEEATSEAIEAIGKLRILLAEDNPVNQRVTQG